MSRPSSSSPSFRGRGGFDRPPPDETDRMTDSRPASPSSVRGRGDDRPDRSDYTGNSTHDRSRPESLTSSQLDKAKFVTLHSLGSTPLAKLNPFIIKKVIDYCVGGHVESVRKLASGDLSVICKSPDQVRDLLKLRKFHDLDVEAVIPLSLNSCKGVATCRDFVEMDERDIIQEMEDQDVIDARFITRMVEGVRRRTASVIFTFAGSQLPERLLVGYEVINVRPYIPNPLRCFKCQSYGHHGKTCRALNPVCGRCAVEGHVAEGCMSLVEKCRNCSGSHSTTSRDCPTWKLEREVCAVKVREGISYYDARKRVKETYHSPDPGATYASKVKPPPEMCTRGMQTDSTPPVSTVPSTDKILTATPVSNATNSTTTSYSEAVVSPTPPIPQKHVKSKDFNFTPLKKSTSHVLPKPAPSRHSSESSSVPGDSGSLVIDEFVEVSGRKGRARPSGGDSPKGGKHKRVKHAGHRPSS